MERSGIDRWLANLEGERDAVFLYGRLAESEANTNLAELYRRLAETEVKHAAFWEGKLAEAGAPVPPFRPSLATRIKARFASRYGAQSVVGSMAKVERAAAGSYDGQAEAELVGMPSEERSHARIFGILARESRAWPEATWPASRAATAPAAMRFGPGPSAPTTGCFPSTAS